MSGKRHIVVDLATNTRRPIIETPPVLSSAAGPWKGVTLEQHAPAGSLEVLDVVSPDHLVVVHLRPSKVLEWKDTGRFRTVSFTTGEISLVPAMVPFSFRTQQGGDVLIVMLERTFLRCATYDLVAGPARVELKPTVPLRDPLVQSLSLALKAEAEAGCPGGRAYGESLAGALAAHLVRHYSEAPWSARHENGGLPRHQLRRVIDFIHAHLGEDVSLAALAAETGLSLFHFARKFKRSTGLAPHQYLLQCRVERAKELLLSGATSIADVAVQVGFCDQSHLTMHFKRVYGVTPRGFQQQARLDRA